jgi:hypothetical protein
MAFSSKGEENVLIVRETASTNSDRTLKRILGFKLLQT